MMHALAAFLQLFVACRLYIYGTCLLVGCLLIGTRFVSRLSQLLSSSNSRPYCCHYSPFTCVNQALVLNGRNCRVDVTASYVQTQVVDRFTIPAAAAATRL